MLYRSMRALARRFLVALFAAALPVAAVGLAAVLGASPAAAICDPMMPGCGGGLPQVQEPTTTTVSVSPQQPTAADQVTITVTVTAAQGTPDGVVSIWVDNGIVTTQQLTGGPVTHQLTLSEGQRKISATYAGSQSFLQSNGAVMVQVAAPPPKATTLQLAASATTVEVGNGATFTATLQSGSKATGTVTFTLSDGRTQAVALVADTASLTLPMDTPGTVIVSAAYSGDARFAASGDRTSVAVTAADSPAPEFSYQVPGFVRVHVAGEGRADVSVNGRALGSATSSDSFRDSTIPPGPLTISITVASASPGRTIRSASVSCSGRPAQLVAGMTYAFSASLEEGGAVSCSVIIIAESVQTVTATIRTEISYVATTALPSFLKGSIADQIVSALGPSSRPAVNSFTALLAMLPGAAAGGPVQAGGSLAALDKAMGKDTGKRRRLDVWFDARWQGVQAGGSAGNFAAGAVGLDYRLTEKVVIGAFASVDHGSLAQTAGAGRVSGIGWVAGTYAGARISKNLILQGVLAGGTSWNTVSPLGTYTDSYTTTRFIASTSLAGDWKRGAWTFSPTVSLSYATETSAEYVDTPGNTIAAATTGVFEGSAGPGFRYRHVSDNGVVVEPGLKLDVIARLASGGAGAGTTTLFGRLTPSIQLGFAGGAGLRLTTNVEVGANFLSYGASARATLPLR